MARVQGFTTRLVRSAPVSTPDRTWDEDAQRLLAGPQGSLRVLGGPGTGKTALLAATAAARVRQGTDPENLLVLTSSRRAAEHVRFDITRELTETPSSSRHTTREPLVRTVHSYAYAVLRLQAGLTGLPAPRLLSGPEQDVVVRELLAGDLERGAVDWPAELRSGLAVPGFAEELRDLLLRAAERGLGPDDLVKLGHQQDRAEWVSAGVFWQQYEEVTLLQSAGGQALGEPGAPAFDAAELVASALVELEGDPDLLARERSRIRHVFVDDVQHLDPLQYRLLRLLGHGTEDFVLAGDPDQAVFSFRGADPNLLLDADPDGGRTITLTRAHRLTSAVHRVVTTVAEHLPGAHLQREYRPVEDTEGRTKTRLLPTAAAEAGWVADQLRRAHLVDGVAWSQMAVLMRSPSRVLPVLQRALHMFGVPVASATEELPLAQQPAVRPLLTILRLAADPDDLDADTADMLLASSLGGADPLALRRLRRGLRRLELAGGGDRPSDDLLVVALRDGDQLAGLADTEAAPVRRVGGLLRTAREAVADDVGVEEVLWRVWQASKLQDTLLRRIDRGGSLGDQADRDLDAVVALFDAAARYVDRLPNAGVAGFAEYLGAQHIAGDSLAPVAVREDGVELLTAHAAAGREWSVVAIVGVQEGVWPDLRPRGSLLGVERLVDLLAGVDTDTTSAMAPVLAEERRLFYLAASRAEHTLLVSAVQAGEEQPSRFLDELIGSEEQESESGTQPHVSPSQRPLVLAELVGELRAAVCDPETAPTRRARAARQLARLAQAGVPGAHPHEWYGLVDLSTHEPLHDGDDIISVSPSTVETLARCPLRWLLERHGGSDPAQLTAVTGILMHTLAQAAAAGADTDQLRAELDQAWSKIDAGAPWFSRRERRRVEQMIQNFLTWLQTSRTELTELGVEQDMRVELPPSDDGHRVVLSGRVDRLESDSHGRPMIIDLKTSKSAVSEAEAQAHPQLAAYQLALLLGAFQEGGVGRQAHETGGAGLVYVAKGHNRTGSTQRRQPVLDADAAQQWLELIRAAAAATIGPEYVVQENAECARCPVRSACPLRIEGRQVTDP